MSADIQHTQVKYQISEVKHSYGAQYHILSDPYMLSLLTQLCSPDTKQPLINIYTEVIYTYLLSAVVNTLFQKKHVCAPTRMKRYHVEGEYEGEIIDPEQKVVCVNMARAGTLPTYICYHRLNYLLNPEYVRQDHFYVNRKVNDQNEVIGMDVSGAKIAGDVDDAYVLFPDPMGATGGTIVHAVDHYKRKIYGNARQFVALHLIVTPEYLKNLHLSHPDVHVVAVRLDRGLSTPEILKTLPGTHWDKERGLNEHQYIVPGAGGLGELLNNAHI